MFGVSLPELLVIGIVALIVFGPDKLPELARNLGNLTAQLRRASENVRREFYREVYPPLPDNPLVQAKRELMAVKSAVESDVHNFASHADSISPRHTVNHGPDNLPLEQPLNVSGEIATHSPSSADIHQNKDPQDKA